MPNDRDNHLTRRQVLGAAAAGTGAIILAGCGSTSPATTTSTSTTAGNPRRGGTFRWGASDSSSADSLDPLLADNTNTNSGRCQNLYDTLMAKPHASPTVVPNLAEEMTPATDLSYWTVRLREATFHDGKPVTADDVIFTLKRVLNPKNPGTSAGLISTIDPKRLTKLDNRTVRIYLTTGDVNLPQALSFPGTAIVPVDYEPKNPIGSGPFKYVSFSPGVRSVFARYDNYWKSGQPYLDELVVVGFADPNTTRLNALTGGQIDGMDSMAFTLVPTVEAASGINLVISPAHSGISFDMRMDIPPFDDVRVRQAIKLIAGREQIVEHAYDGPRFGVIGNDLPSPQDPLYDNSIPQRTQDIEQAKSLLKQAGREGLTVPLAVSPVTAGVVETAQVLAQQATAAGVTIKVNNVQDAATYYSKYLFPAPFKIDYFGSYSMWNIIGFGLLPGAPYNDTHWSNAKWLSLVTKARATLDVQKRSELMAEAQTIYWNEGSAGFFAFSHTAEAYSKNFAGIHPDIWGYSLNGLYFDEVYQV